MKKYDSQTMQLPATNSYLRLFQSAQENWMLWQREEKERRIKKQLAKSHK
jgi:hypothetical protein